MDKKAYSQIQQYVIKPLVLFFIANKKKIFISSSVVALFNTCYLLYNKIDKPPRYTRHIPYVGFFKFMGATIRKEPLDKITKEITFPIAFTTDTGLYSRFDHDGWKVVVNNPILAKKVMFGSEFTKTALGEFWTGTILGRFIIGPNLFCVVDRQWKKQRKIANPAFRRSMPLPLFGRLTQKLFKVIDSSTTGEDTPITINVHPLMKRWTLDTLGNASFEFDFGAIDDSNNEWVLRYETILHACEAPLFALFPFLERRFLNWFPERKRIHDELTLFLDKMQEIIDKKRNKLLEQQKQQQDELGQKKASPSSSDDSDYSNEDLLSLMIQNQLQETDVNNTLTDEELKSNLCVFFMAGNDTTTAALSFMIYHLAKHPEIQERARQEAFRVLGNEPTDIIPTIQQSQELVYITMVINETLRITGPADSLTPRTATKDTELGGVFIPKGTNVTVSLYELHHNPRFWDQPDVFDPERFASSDSQQNNGDDDDANNNSINATHCSNKEMFAPFSSGSRVCIGKNLSMAQQKLFLPMLLRKYRWDLPEDSIHREKVITETTMDVVHPVNLNINFKRIY